MSVSLDTESALLYNQAVTLAKRKYGEMWESYLDKVKADLRELAMLRLDGLVAMSDAEKLGMRIRGIHMTPKHDRAERLERWQAERAEKIAAYKAAKEKFETLSSKLDK